MRPPGRFEEFGIFNVYGTTLQLNIAARRARPISGSNSGLSNQRAEERRTGKVNTNAPPRLTDGEAERLAREFVAKLGVTLDESYLTWDGAWGIRSNRFHNSFRDWTYHWNRHIKGIPVWNDRVLVSVDDQLGQLIGFNIYTQPFRDADAIKPVLTLEQAQRIAVKEGQRQADFNGWGRGKMMTWPDPRVNRLYYYIEEDFALGRFTRLKQPRLHLVYAIELGSYRDGDPKQQFDFRTKVLVDAVTGEIVPQADYLTGG